MDLFNNGYNATRANIKRFADLGLDVHITELDVKCHLQNGNCTMTTWSAADLEKQANVYKTLLLACLDEPGCKSFETWGFSDKYSWLPFPENGLPFDRSYKEKPALQVLR